MPPVGPRLPAHSQLRKLVAGGAERADMQAEGVITAGMASYAWHSLTNAPEGGVGGNKVGATSGFCRAGCDDVWLRVRRLNDTRLKRCDGSTRRGERVKAHTAGGRGGQRSSLSNSFVEYNVHRLLGL